MFGISRNAGHAQERSRVTAEHKKSRLMFSLSVPFRSDVLCCRVEGALAVVCEEACRGPLATGVKC